MIRCSTDGHRPPVDLEDAALVARLFALFHGTPDSAPGVPPAERATPAGPALQARLMGMFTRSVAAANAFPAVLQARLAVIAYQFVETLLGFAAGAAEWDIHAQRRRRQRLHGCAAGAAR